MIFNSLDFILFFILFFILYILVPRRLRYLFVLLSSYYFYAYHNAIWLYLIIGLTFFIYVMGLLIERYMEYKKVILLTTVIVLLSILGYYKYREFIYSSFSYLFNFNMMNIDTIKIYDLPLAISFFTFEFIHYIVDVYKGAKPIKNIFQFALFPAFFPTMIAGPIKRFQDFSKQLNEKSAFSINIDFIAQGLHSIIIGLFLKVVFSDYICLPIVDKVYAHIPKASSMDILVAMLSFSFQIFYDFAGYSLIAIGLAKIMGINIPMNFNSPYLAMNISDFWRRWHITLSMWLKDYLYISLGGSRVSKVKIYRNLLITMMLGGLWHGAGLNFLIWGTLHGIALIIYHYYIALRNNKQLIIDFKYNHILSVFLTFTFVTFTWVFFRLEHFNDAISVFHRLLFNSNYKLLFVSKSEYTLLAIVAFFTFLGPLLFKNLQKIINSLTYLRVVYLNILVLFILITIPLFKNPVFIYFKF